MVISRAPYRISFAGGGSDLRAFYANQPGAVLASAINKYMYVTVKERFGGTFRIGYSRTELAESVDEIQHPIVREALRLVGIDRGLEIVSIGDLPARAGMGSSSAFAVCLLQALHALQGNTVSPQRLAEEACHIEIDLLREPIGKQDQYMAAYGGLRFVQFQPDEDTFVDLVLCNPEARRQLSNRLLLFFTNQTRDARSVLSLQVQNTKHRQEELQQMCAIAREMCEVLTLQKDLNQFGRLMDQAWQLKKRLADSVSNVSIDAYYSRALEAGAIGGKLLGAGNGGFLLFFCEPHLQNQLRSALSDLQEVSFRLEPEGAKVIFVEDTFQQSNLPRVARPASEEAIQPLRNAVGRRS